MRRILFAETALALAAVFTASCAIAQNAPQSAQGGPQAQEAGGGQQGRPGGGGGGMGGPRPQTMDLALAQKIADAVQAAIEAADEQAAICIMDSNGDIVVFERIDETNRIPVGTAEGKARAVLMFGVPTAEVATAQRNPVPLQVTPPAVGSAPAVIATMSGGLPIYKDGKMIGAMGVGGADSKDAGDAMLAQIGIEAAGLSSTKDAARPTPSR
jgi:glc operon protein GlcG